MRRSHPASRLIHGSEETGDISIDSDEGQLRDGPDEQGVEALEKA